MPPTMQNPYMGSMQGSETNLLSILINVAFGFEAGLIFLFGIEHVLAYGSHLATQLIKMSGYGQSMAAFGFVTSAAPFIILAPIGGLVLKELSSVRSIKSFVYFAIAVIAGFALAYISQGYFAPMMSPR